MEHHLHAPPIGIDLGNAYTRIAVYDGSQWRMIPDDHDYNGMPSYVAFTNSGVLVGEAARNQAQENPTNTIFDIIRLIGRRYSDPSVRNDMRLWPFQVSASPDDRLLVDVSWKSKLWHSTPVEICSLILTQMKKNVETNLRSTIVDAVITVPVHYNYEQRQAIRQAGMIAGLNFMQIISVPAASALFFGMKRQLSESSRTFGDCVHSLNISEYNMIIFHVGPGTLDVSLVTIKENMCKVRATAGNVHLSVSDFGNTTVDYFVKILADMCLKDAKMGTSMVHEVIIAGGSTRIPLLRFYVQQYFKGKKLNLNEQLDTATAYGAALQAFLCFVKDNRRVHCLSLLDVTPFTLGIKSSWGMMVICVPKNTTIPTKMETIISHSHSHSHSHYNETKFLFEVYEGDRRLSTENNLLGKFELCGIPISCDINVSFEIHENGTLTVTAEEISSGMRKGITITDNNIDDSRNRVWEALLYKESENNINKECSITKSLNQSDTLSKMDQIKKKGNLPKLLSINKEIEKCINKASTTKSVTQSGTSSKSNLVKDKLQRQCVEPEEYAIGIDFGTTYSRVAVCQRYCVKIIENEYGSRLTCSAVAFTDAGRLIGDTVYKEQVTTNPANTIPNIKRLIGRCYDQSDPNDSEFLPFKIFRCEGKNRSMISVEYMNEKKLFAPEEIAAMILSKMKEIAEAHLRKVVTKAVISVPACFSDSHRQAIKDAGVIAGLNVLQLLNEPTAAAIAYFMQKASAGSSREKTLLIFDLGGGNLDVSILTINEGIIRVRAVVGDTKLGGEDFDNNMVVYFVEKFMEEKNKNIHNKPKPLRRLRAACEKAKRVLSTNAQTVVEIDALDEGIDFHSAITREAFEELNKSLFERSISCVERCLEDAKMNRSCIDEVVLVGGSTRIPKMQQVLREFFKGKELCKSMNADEAVVYGAAVQAAILSGNEDSQKFNITKLRDVTSLSFGLESKNGAITNVLIPKHTPIPEKKELLFTANSDNLSSFSIDVQECELASLTVFNISGITPQPRVKSKITVSFEVDDSGILNLKAKDMSTREKNEIVISKENVGLTTEEIEEMVEAAAHYKAQDEEHKVRAAALNSLEKFAYEMKAKARDQFSSVSALDKKLMKDAAEKAIAWLDANHHAGIDEIKYWKRHLENIKNQINYLN